MKAWCIVRLSHRSFSHVIKGSRQVLKKLSAKVPLMMNKISTLLLKPLKRKGKEKGRYSKDPHLNFSFFILFPASSFNSGLWVSWESVISTLIFCFSSK